MNLRRKIRENKMLIFLTIFLGGSFYMAFYTLSSVLNDEVKGDTYYLFLGSGILEVLIPIIFILGFIVNHKCKGDEKIRQQKRIESFFFAVASIALLIMIGPFAYGKYLNSKTCIRSGIVKNIGGCDMFGSCSVLMDNGEKLNLQKPVVNEFVCIEQKGFF